MRKSAEIDAEEMECLLANMIYKVRDTELVE